MALFEIVNCCDNWIWSPALYFQQPGCESLGGGNPWNNGNAKIMCLFRKIRRRQTGRMTRVGNF